MSKDGNKCDNTHPNTVPKNTNKNVSNENVVTPEVKILNRGDLLGAINCLFPELQLKSSHIKLKENFSLFSYSPQELAKIFESGRKYRTRIVKNIKCSFANHSIRSLRTDSSRSGYNTNVLGNVSTKNIVSASTTFKSKAQAKENPYLRKRYETVQFQSSYTDFVTKFLESLFPDRFADFKNVECVIQELHNLYKEISKEDKIGPFNPNLPVLNISKCDQVVRISSGSKDVLRMKSSTSIKHIRNKKKSRSHIAIKTLKTQNEAKGKDKRFKAETKKHPSDCHHPGPINENENESGLTLDFDDENGKNIAKNVEDLLSDDTFTPRYNAKHASDMFMIFRNSFSKNDLITSFTDQLELEKEAIEQYQNIDDAVDMNLNLLEIQARQQYEP